MKSRYLIIFLVLISCLQAVGQNTIDSLLSVLKTEKEDTGKVNTLNRLSYDLLITCKYDTDLICANSAQALAEKLAYKKGIAGAIDNMGNVYYYKSNYPMALEYYNKALVIDREIGNNEGVATLLGNIGLTYWNQGNYSRALEFMFKSLTINEESGNKNAIASILGNIGLVYWNEGNYPKALEYDFKALTICQEIGKKKGVANNFSNIGIVYANQNNYPKALEYDQKALKIDREIGDKKGIASNLGNIGSIYAGLGNYTQALEYFNQALAMYRANGNKKGISINLGCIGNIYSIRGDQLKALDYTLQALAIDREIGFKSGIAGDLLGTGNIYTKQKNYKQAKAYLDSAIILSKKIGDINITKASYSGMALLDSVTGNYKTSLEDYKNYITYRDSIVNDATKQKILQTQFTYAYKMEKDSIQDAEDKLNLIAEKKSQQQKAILYSFIGAFAFMLLLAFLIFLGYRQKQKANLLITQQKKEVEKQKELVEEKNKDITDSINYAKRIQRAILKEEEHVSMHLPEHFILFKPKDIVSGDFYWAVEKEEYFYFAAVDCTGHGVPGGFMSMLGMAFLNEITKGSEIQTPAEILNELRTKILKEFKQKEGEDQTKDGMDISLMRMNLKTREIQWSGANNPLYVIDNELKETPADKQPIGYFPVMKPFTNHTIKSEKGSILYLFSDGYSDQFGGPKAKKFKHSQFKDALLSIHKKGMKEQKIILNETFENWKGHLEQVDDILVIGIRV